MNERNNKSKQPIENLKELMARLRHETEGCPWDREQTFASVAPYTIEEAYEVSDAIDCDDMLALKEELGDLLLQVVFHSRMAEENGDFDFDDVAQAITDKMIRRHPHVFGNADERTQQIQGEEWEKQKKRERSEKALQRGDKISGIMDDVALALPALMRAEKLGKRASRIGFDRNDIQDVISKLNEKMQQFQSENVDSDSDLNKENKEKMIGDLLFSVVNLSRHLKVDTELALRKKNSEFENNFRKLENNLQACGKIPEEANLIEMMQIWSEIK